MSVDNLGAVTALAALRVSRAQRLRSWRAMHERALRIDTDNPGLTRKPRHIA